MRAFGYSIIALSVLAALADPAWADEGEVQAAFQAANGAYLKGDYKAAVVGYDALIETHGVDDVAVYANLGNANFRQGRYGYAVYWYRRALRLEPPAELATRLKANLATTRRVLSERYRTGADKTLFIYNEPGGLLYTITHAIDATVLSVLFFTFWFALFALLALRRLRPAWRVLPGFAIPTAILSVLLGLMLWGQHYTGASVRLGVVVDNDVVLREGRHSAARGDDIPEGMELRILEPTEGWSRVELSTGREGWVRADAIKSL